MKKLLLLALPVVLACAGNRNATIGPKPEPRTEVSLNVSPDEAFGTALDVITEHGWPTIEIESGAHYISFAGGDDGFWSTRCMMTLRILDREDGTSQVRVTADVTKLWGEDDIEAGCRETVLAAMERAVTG